MTDLAKTWAWSSVLAHQGVDPWINTYEAHVRMQVVTGVHDEYNLAYSRLRYWFQDIMHDAVLLDHADPRLPAWRSAGMLCIEFPVAPVDQVIGLMLMSKLTAMTEGRVIIQEVTVSSPADEYVAYHCDKDDNLHWFEESGWWRDSGPNHVMDTKPARGSSKVISIQRSQTWKDHDLEWASTTGEQRGNVSVLPNRDRDA